MKVIKLNADLVRRSTKAEVFVSRIPRTKHSPYSNNNSVARQLVKQFPGISYVSVSGSCGVRIRFNVKQVFDTVEDFKSYYARMEKVARVLVYKHRKKISDEREKKNAQVRRRIVEKAMLNKIKNDIAKENQAAINAEVRRRLAVARKANAAGRKKK